jgi:hypothetical protein
LLCDGGVKLFHPLRSASLCPAEADSARLAEPDSVRPAEEVCERSPAALSEREAGVPALGFPEAEALRDSEAVSRPPALGEEIWFCCIDCCKRAVCCWNDGVCAALWVPAKCVAAPE